MTKPSLGVELAIITVKRYAKIKHGISLEDSFWKDPQWKRTFQNHCVAANSLLKVYAFDVIMQVLKKHPKTWSLRSSYIQEDLIMLQRRYDSRPKTENKPEPVIENPTFRTDTFRKNHGEEEE